MSTDVNNDNALAVSLRDHFDKAHQTHEDLHGIERNTQEMAIESQRRYADTVITDHFRTHDKEHDQVKVAFENYLRQLELSSNAHKDLHRQDGEAVKVALEGVSRMATLHGDNHTKEHASHELVHQREKEADDLARHELGARLAELNEYRAQVREQTMTFMSRNEINALFDRVNAAISTINQSAENAHNRMDRSYEERNKIFQTQIDKLNLSAAADTGASQRTTVLIGAGFTIMTLLIAIVGIYLGSQG